MYSHSRSSSEVCTMDINSILPIFFRDFKENFDFDDVKSTVKELFDKEELQAITNEANEERKLVRLFSVLCSKQEVTVQKFLKLISNEYDFLVNGIYTERDNPSKKTILYIDNILNLKSSHPKHTNFNVMRINLYMELCRLLRKLQPYHSVVLDGDLGIGKKWLALSACQNYDVMNAMDFKIYWLDVSNCTSPEQDLHFLQSLRLMLGGTSPSHSPTFSNGANSGSLSGHHEYNESVSNRKLELQQCIRKKLKQKEYRDCLLVLKDVQNFKTYETFNLGSKLLLITRNKKIGNSLPSNMSTNLTIRDGLTEMEFFTLFEKYLRKKRDVFPRNAIEIYKYSQGHPLLLSIIAQNLRQKHTNWEHWIGNKESLEIPKNKFKTIVDISLNVLKPERLRLYATLSIFPHSVPIPIKLIAFLWDKSLHQTKEIVQQFNKYSFVNIEPCPNEPENETCCCIIPFIYSEHLEASESLKSLVKRKELHLKVLNYYNIEETFNQRTETDLCNSQHDLYFFTYIGYHLQKAHYDNWFRKIFLDFGFLEQKMRAVGLSNTISDLKYFEEKIANCDSRKRDLLSELCNFLPQIEEKLTESKDTSLLQYALMASGTVYEEATRQIQKFAQRVWFTERGNFHKRRQIVKLKDQAKFIIFLEQELCLLVLKNNNMILLDISLDCTTNCILFKNDSRWHATIIEIRLFHFDKKKFILTLDLGGTVKLWSISEDHRQGLMYRRSSKQKVNAPNFHTGHKVQPRKCEQIIQQNSMGQNGQVVAFFIEQLSQEYDLETSLHLAFSNGDICVFKWDRKDEVFVPKKVPILPTGNTDIKFLSKILNTYYIILNKSGDISFRCLRDSSEAFAKFNWPEKTIEPLSYEIFTSNAYTCVIFVFVNMVLKLTFEHKIYMNKLEPTVDILYETSRDDITCAKLSIDQHYLVLGTKYGLILYDVHSKSEVLRSNISEIIACIDIYPLDDRIFKYIIICGAENREVLNILAVRKTEDNALSWAHNVTSMGNELSTDPQLEADVWLQGVRGLFDVYFKNDGSALVLAVDSKNRVHQVNITKTKSWMIIMPSETTEPITAITTGIEQSFVAYNNGTIFNINKEAFESPSMVGSIHFLQLFDDCHLIASTAQQTSLRNVRSSQNEIIMINLNTKVCYKLYDQYFLLITDNGIITLLKNSESKYALVISPRHGLQQHASDMYKLCGCDFKMGYLCLATKTFINVFRYEMIGIDVRNKSLSPLYMTKKQSSSISCLSLSRDASLLAVGFENGDIEVYKFPNDYMSVYTLQSHHARIYDIQFSPCNKVLVSCAEQLCFWSVNYLLNNPLMIQQKKRRSSRFSSQRSRDVEEVDAKVISQHNNYLSVHIQTPHMDGNDGCTLNEVFADVSLSESQIMKEISSAWCDKEGPADKPELLACIKFDGNKAERFFANEDFTQFSTIDDEGVYYNLNLIDNIEKPTNENISINDENINFNANSWRVEPSDIEISTLNGDPVDI